MDFVKTDCLVDKLRGFASYLMRVQFDKSGERSVLPVVVLRVIVYPYRHHVALETLA